MFIVFAFYLYLRRFICGVLHLAFQSLQRMHQKARDGRMRAQKNATAI